MQEIDAFTQRLTRTEYGRVTLHDLLHLEPDLGCGALAIRIAEPVYTIETVLTRVRSELLVARAGRHRFGAEMRCRTTENDKIQ